MTTKKMSLVRQSMTDAPNAARLPGFVLAFLLLVLSGFTTHAAAPVMTLPSTVTIPEDEATNLVFSVTDADSPLYTVTITATSSDTTLVPNANLDPSGAGGTRFLAITPALHKYGTTTITVIATDDNLEKSTNTFTLNVTFTNYPPAFTTVATNRVIREDAGGTNLTFAISDVETALSNLTVTATSTNTTLVPNGNLVLSGTTANRTLNVTSVTNLFGTNLISIVVTDGGSAKATNNVLLTVLSVNDAPTFSISTNRIDQNEDAGLTTVSNFLASISSGPSNESSQSNWLVLNYTTNFFAQEPAVDGSGTLTFQVATNSNGTNSITFILADDGGTANLGKDRSTNTLTLAVASVNDLPLITTNISNLTIGEDAGRTNLSYSIFDADHALTALTITATSTNTSLVPTNGFTFTGTSSNRTVGVTPLTNAFGATEISLVVTDPAGGTATNKFVLTVSSVADAPILGDTTNRTFLEDATTNLSGMISLYDADTAITNVGVTVTSSDTNIVGVAFSATNNVSSNSLTLTLDYTPKTNANGSATIAVVANDGAVSTTNSFTVTVTAVNDMPSYTLSTNLVLIAEDAGAITNTSFLTGLSTGPANETNQTFTFTVTSGTNFAYATAPAISTGGALTFRTATNAVGTNTITVVMKDNGGVTGGGVDSVTNTFNIAVTAVNDAAYFTGITAKSILEDATTNNTAVVNVIDPDTANTNVAVTVASSDTNLVTVAITSTNAVGTTNSALTLTFTPLTNANGSATITLVANDGALSTTNSLVLTVTAVNDLPAFTVSTNLVLVAEDAGAITNTSFLAGISAGPGNETNQTWTFTLTTGTNFGFATAPAISTNGTLTFRTATNAVGTNLITVVMEDSGGTAGGGKDSVTNTFSIGVIPANDAPTFAGIAAKTILEDSTTNTAVINAIDTDTASSNLVVTATSSDTNLVGVAITATNLLNSTNAALTLALTPVTNANGSATITLVANDGALSTTNSFALTVTAVNDLPAFTVSTNLVLVAEDAGTITNASFLTSLSTGPTNESAQTYTFTLTTGTNFTFTTAPAVSTNGTLTFRVATNSVGTNLITVVMKDSGGVTGGGKDSVTNTFSIGVTPVNDAPYLVGVAAKTILEDISTNTMVVNVIDTDTANTSVSVTATSSDTNLVAVSISATNAIGTTNSALTLSFAPLTNAYGSATITLIANDGALSTTNTFALTVSAVNDLPGFTVSTNLVLVAEDAGAITNASFLTSLSSGPANETNQTWTFTVTSGTNFSFATAPAIGTNGTLTFRTATNAVGTNLITVVMKDSGGVTGGGKDSVTNTFSIGVTPANDAPVFSGIVSKTILEDSTTNTMVINAIDTDTASSNLVVTVTSSDTNLATVAITATNILNGTNAAFTLGFTPLTNASGSLSITVVANDGALSTTNSFLLTVSAVNDLPAFTVSTNLVLVAEDAGTITNASFLTGLSAGPTNEAAQTYTFTLTSGTNFSFATAPAISTNGTLTFRTATNAVGTNLITVVMKDSGGTTGGGKDSVTNTFSIGVTPANDAPTFTGVVSKTILEDATTNTTAIINVIDTDTSSSNVVVTASSSDTNIATVAITSTNLLNGTNAAYTLTFSPKTNANGSLSITLVANDGALSTTNSFLLTVSAVNDLPAFTVSTNLVLIAEDAGGITNASFLTGLSSGPTNEASQTYTFTLTSGTNFSFATAPAISTNGTLTFRTATNAVGTNLITVVMKDNGGTTGGGKDSVTNTFSIAVTSANDAPYFTGITSKTILEDATTNNTAVVTVIDTDTTSTNVSVTVSSSDTNLATVAITVTNVVNATNSALTLTFSPKTNATGSATITLIANDGALNTTNSFLLTVSAVNDLPAFTVSTNLVLVAEDAGTITNASFLTGLSAGPTNEAAQTYTFTLTSGTNFNFATTPAISTNGTLTFRTATNAVGTNLITVVMKDTGGTTGGGKDSVTNTFSIGVTPVNDAPTFTGVVARTILEDPATNATAVINVIDTDTVSSNLVVTVSSSNTNLATVAITSTNVINSTNAALTLTFTPLTNANGSATITLIANDGALSTTNSFTLNVTAVNDLPSFTVSTNLVLVAEDAGGITNASFLTGISTGPTNEAAQTWAFTVTSGTNFSFATAPAISTNGTLTFRTATNAVGTNLITVVMKDNGGTTGGGKDSVTNTFSIGVTPVNDAPGFTGIASKSIREDATSTNTAVINVLDSDSAITNVSVTVSSSDTNLAEVAITSTNLVSLTNAALTLTFTPKTNANGSLSITVIANDGAVSTTNSFLLTVSAVNDAPGFALSTNLVLLAEDAGFVTNAGFATSISTGPTNEASQTFAFTVTSGTNFGYVLAPSITTNGALIFKTATNAIGTNLITVVLKDNGGVANGGKDTYTNTFSLAVTAQNDAPSFTGIVSKTIREDATSTNAAVINVLDSDSAITNVSVTVSSSDTNIATVAITSTNLLSATNAAFTLTFTPLTNINGSLSITLVANDGALSTTNSFLLTVSAVNDVPGFALSTNLVLIAEDAGMITNANFLSGLSSGPTNEANQTWTFTVTSGTNFTYATAPTISTNGTLIFNVATNAVGTNVLAVVMKDNGGVANGGRDSVTNTFTLAVTPVNDAAYFTGAATKTILEDGTTNLTSTLNVIDVDTASTNVTVTASSSDTNLATVVITSTNVLSGTNAQLVLTYAPKTNANGSATITLIANDGALSTTNSFLLNVTAVNDIPSFNLAITSYTVDKFNIAVSITNAVTNIFAGALNESNQVVSFLMSNNNTTVFTTQPTISTNGLLTFTPAAKGGTATVTVRAKDNGGVTGGGVDTAAPQTFTITVPPNPFVALGGAYAGLFFDTNTMANDSSGYFKLTLATNGAFTGHILRAGTSNVFSGQFSPASPTLSLAVSNTPCVVNMTLDTGVNWTETISGSVSNTTAGWSVQLLSYLNVNAGGFPAALAGEYMVAIPGNASASAGPPGDATLAVTIANNGGVTLSGYLSDDTFVSQATHLSRSGSVPFYAGVGATGSASGWLTFKSTGTSHLQSDSEVVFIRGAGGSYYPSGFTNATIALGSFYDDTATDLLTMGSGSVVLSGGGLASPITTTYTLANNVITVDPSATNGLALAIFRNTGQVSGTFNSGGQTAEISSVILQSTNVARGYFVLPGGVGRFILY